MIQFACPKCGRPIRVSDSAAGQKGKCKDCGNLMVIPSPQPAAVVIRSPEPRQKAAEETLYDSHPAMFRNKPILFVLCLASCFVLVGIPAMLLWWFSCHCTTLTVSNTRTTLRHGFFSKRISEIWHRDVRNITVAQSFMQRIFGTGTVEISSSGQGGVEISVAGMRSPYKIKSIVDAGR